MKIEGGNEVSDNQIDVDKIGFIEGGFLLLLRIFFALFVLNVGYLSYMKDSVDKIWNVFGAYDPEERSLKFYVFLTLPIAIVIGFAAKHKNYYEYIPIFILSFIIFINILGGGDFTSFRWNIIIYSLIVSFSILFRNWFKRS